MGDLFGAIANVIGTGAKVGLGEQAAGEFNDPKNAYQNLNPNLAMPDVAQGDPGTQAAQQMILQQALQRMRSGGLNAMDLGRLNAIRSSQAQQTRAGQAASMSDAQQRGALQGNSGILGSMVAGQQAANTGADQALQANGQALQEQNQQQGAAANMAGTLRGQNIGVEEGNINRKQQQTQNNYTNALNRAGGLYNVAGGQANALNGVGTSAQQLGNAVGGTAGGIWDYYNKKPTGNYEGGGNGGA